MTFQSRSKFELTKVSEAQIKGVVGREEPSKDVDDSVSTSRDSSVDSRRSGVSDQRNEGSFSDTFTVFGFIFSLISAFHSYTICFIIQTTRGLCDHSKGAGEIERVQRRCQSEEASRREVQVFHIRFFHWCAAIKGLWMSMEETYVRFQAIDVAAVGMHRGKPLEDILDGKWPYLSCYLMKCFCRCVH